MSITYLQANHYQDVSTYVNVFYSKINLIIQNNDCARAFDAIHSVDSKSLERFSLVTNRIMKNVITNKLFM
jgi:hypothetical protein